MRAGAAAFDWDGIDLVAFDVDGTLYRQDRLRRKMMAELARHMVLHGSVAPMRILSAYRRQREKLAEDETPDFEDVLLAHTAGRCGVAPASVEALVRDWMETRPLKHLGSCLYPQLPELFAALKRRRKTIGIVSDYPARQKLQALGLEADFIVAAGDENVGYLKPHPRGLQALMAAAGVSPRRVVLIGDRPERDGMAARRAGAAALIRSTKPIEGWTTFSGYGDPVFSPLLIAP